MGVLQRKKDGTGVISVRVPSAINAKLVELRRRAHAVGLQLQRDVGRSSEPRRRSRSTQELDRRQEQRRFRAARRGRAESAAVRMAG